jgi:DNA-binding MarR family transcriptional regulator
MNRKEKAKPTLIKNTNQHARKSTKDSPADRETLDLLILIGWTRDIIRKVRQKELAPYGLNPDKAAVLQVIQNLGGSARPSEIAPKILRERHSVHELLRRMEKARLLKKTNSTRRKNGIVFELTEKGREAHGHVSKRKLVHKIFSSLSKDDRKHLIASLRILFDTAHKTIIEEQGSSKIISLLRRNNIS